MPTATMTSHTPSVVIAERGDPARAFRYRNAGSMATIGRGAAVADIRGLRLWGYLAWVLWTVAHVYFLIGARNRLVVATNWAWNYLTSDPRARLITGPLPLLPVAGTATTTGRAA